MQPEDTDPRPCRRCEGTFPDAAFPITNRLYPNSRTLCGGCVAALRRRSMRRLVERRRGEGSCLQCGAPRLTQGVLCLLHWAVRMGCGNGKRPRGMTTQAHARVLLALLEAQDYRCALTGDLLIPGVNASLDHLLPVSLGGTHEPHNLQWVTHEVNGFRGTKTVAEYIAVCRRVVAYADRLHSPHALAGGQ